MMIFAFLGLVLAILVYLYLTEIRHEQERRELYQRIQAPQIAVNEMVAEQIVDPLETYISIDDDEAFNKYRTEANS